MAWWVGGAEGRRRCARRVRRVRGSKVDDCEGGDGGVRAGRLSPKRRESVLSSRPSRFVRMRVVRRSRNVVSFFSFSLSSFEFEG